MIDYDASRSALYRPAERPTLFAAGVDPGLEATCAECARLAYLRFESSAEARERLVAALAAAGLADFHGFADRRTGSEAFAARFRGDGTALVVFRGTVPGDFADLATDLDARSVAWSSGGRVHAGFAAAFAGIRDDIDRWLHALAGATRVVVTGHSLGAALATLAMSHWRAHRLITFGSPRVGDSAFVATIDRDASMRFVGCCDAVCGVPPAGRWYSHAGVERYIDREGSVQSSMPSAEVARDRMRARADYLVRFAGRRGNVLARDLADHAPINYVRALLSSRQT